MDHDDHDAHDPSTAGGRRGDHRVRQGCGCAFMLCFFLERGVRACGRELVGVRWLVWAGGWVGEGVRSAMRNERDMQIGEKKKKKKEE